MSVASTSTEIPAVTASDVPAVNAVRGDDPATAAMIDRLIGVAINGLGPMYRAEDRTFAYTRRRARDGGLELAGESTRYGAITLLGIHRLPDAVQRVILHGDTADTFAGVLVERLGATTNLGDVALIAWAAAEMRHAGLAATLDRMAELDDGGPCETVIAAWVVSALTAAREQADVAKRLDAAVRRLTAAPNPAGRGIYPHYTSSAIAPAGRGHVACFADQVYPIQALARYGAAMQSAEAMDQANACAARICEVLGPAGQWWWHYDARTGKVLEGYPVYTVHQDSMAPMALLDLSEAGGDDHGTDIRHGLDWMRKAREVGHSLIDDEQAMIWRKVGRTDPRKLVRAVRAGVSRVHSSWRLRAIDTVFPATRIDFECRPYHLGWILHAWIRGSA